MDTRVIIATFCAYLVCLISSAKGKITCECTTLDCYAERRKTCEALSYCYVEVLSGVVTHGCINDKTPLLCENRKPSRLSSGDHSRWPILSCCNDADFCNRGVVPVNPTEKPLAPAELPEIDTIPDDVSNPYVREEYEHEKNTPCPNLNDSSRLNPIYVAVPVVGLCILLALIIFAMYLLRRRNDFYANYDYRYHEQLAKLANKQNETKTQTCNNDTLNPLTDSERSSQGSETKLFLNA